MEKELRILIVEDAPADAELCERELQRAGLKFTARRVDTRAAFERALQEFDPDLILSDFSMPGAFDGLAALDLARAKSVDVPFIFVSGTIGEDRAVEAMRRGATDYVLKGRLSRLVPVVTRALQEAQERLARRRAQEALRETEERFRTFMQHLPGRASINDREGRYAFVNEHWLRAFGKAAAEILGRTYEEGLPPEQAADLGPVHLQVLETNRPVSRIFRTGAGDDDRWWHSIHFPIPDIRGNTGLVGTISIDITEQKVQEEKIARLSRIHAVLSGINSAIVRIRNRRELFEEACRIAVEHGGFGIAWIGALDPGTLEIIPAACAGVEAESFLARSRNTAQPDSLLGRGMVGRAVREKRAVFSNDLLTEASTGGERRKEAVRRGYRSAIALPLLVEDRAVGNLSLFAREPGFFTDEELRLLTELADDISFALEYIGKEEKLHYLAYYDALTGLPNRALFHERLTQLLHAAKQTQNKVAVLLGDVKRFRLVNDTLGRHAGDALLCELALRLKDLWPDSGNVARISADCFGGVLPEIKEAAEVAHLLEQPLATSLGAPAAVGGKEISVAIAAGIAVYPGDGEDADTLLSNAEAALRKAKASGERYLFYQPEMNARVAETLLLENKMRRALDRQQFVLHYQPRVDLARGTVSGFEALIRWNDPETGLVPPVQFIPLLEETGMILEAGRWAICKALEDRRDWRRRGLRPPRIAVNVSAIQLRQKDFVEAVRDAIGESAAGSPGLDLEITESLVMEDIEGNIGKLRAIRDMGVDIAIDDFGTGYSSLSYLAKLPVNALKIDRSFIVTMVGSPDSMTIVSTIISLAHALNFKVVAEGVETEEQADLLRLLRCDEAQGYLFGRPVPPEDLEELLDRA